MLSIWEIPMEHASSYSVALVNDSPNYVGITEYSLGLYEMLLQNGINVRYYQFMPPNQERRFPSIGTAVKGAGFPLRKYSLEFNQIAGINVRRTASITADIVHLSNPILIPVNHDDRNLICTVHDLYHLSVEDTGLVPRYFNRRWYSRIRSVKHVLAASEYTKAEITRLMGYPENRISVVHNSIDTDFFTPGSSGYRTSLGLRVEDKVLLNVGRDQPNKNLDLLYRSLSRLGAGYKLIRVGNNSKRSLELVKQLGLQNRIVFTQNVTKEVLRDIYRTADIYVHTSTFEGFGRPIGEAMASGIPVISSDRASMPEIVGDAGILLHDLTVDELASRIQDLSTSGEKQDLTVRGLKRITKFSKRTVLDTLLRVYDQLQKGL